MNHNPDLNNVDQWLNFWCQRAINQMKAHMEHRKLQFHKVVDPASKSSSEEKASIWELLNDKKNIVLSANIEPLPVCQKEETVSLNLSSLDEETEEFSSIVGKGFVKLLTHSYD